MKKSTTLISLILIPLLTIAQNDPSGMSGKPLTERYNERPANSIGRENVLKHSSTGFRHNEELYMLSYDDKITVETQTKQVPWTMIESRDVSVYSRNLYLYKRENDQWIRWSPNPIFQAVTNNSNYIDYSCHSKSFVLDNNWVIIGGSYTLYVSSNLYIYPWILILSPIKNEYGNYYFNISSFLPRAVYRRKLKDVEKRGHKKYALLMNDNTEIELNLILEKDSSNGYMKIFDLEDELGPSVSKSSSRFHGEIY